MLNKKDVYLKIIEWFILLQPVVDFLTSLSVRFVTFPLTFGIVVRVIFTGLMCFYLVFFYKEKSKRILVGYLLAVVAYGVLFIGFQVATAGTGVLVENAKMFFKTFYFLFVLVFFFARYKETGYLISDKLLAVVFAEYTLSIFLSAVTNTSFVSYEFATGYVGWFYAANEVGAIVAVLGPVALLFAFETKKLWAKLSLGFLFCFSAVYIGTKVPYYAAIGALGLLMVMYIAKILRTKKGMEFMVQGAAVMFSLILLYQLNSPMKQNSSVFMGEHFDSHVTDVLDPDEEDPDHLDENDPNGKKPTKFSLVLNWFLSDRLYYAENAINSYAEAGPAHKLIGLGNHFQLRDGRTLIEMDFLALLINNGLIGLTLYCIPIAYFAVVCIVMLFKNIKYFFRMRREMLYTYVVLIGMGGALVAGHVLVAPAVSVYVALLIIKLYASFKEEKYKEIST